MQAALKRTLEKKYDRVEKLTNTKHWNVFRVFKDGTPLIAKAIVAAIDEPADIPRANKAFETEVAILRMLPSTWGKKYVDSFVDGPFRVIVTTDVDVVGWPEGPISQTHYKAIVKQLEWLHKHKIAHGDMERKNVLLALDGKPVLIDFEKSIINAKPTDFAADYKLLNSWALAKGGAIASSYKINPNNGNPTLEITLGPGQSVLTNQDVMIYMDGRVGIDYKIGGHLGPLVLRKRHSTKKRRTSNKTKKAYRGGGLFDAIKRGITGQSFFQNVMTNPSKEHTMKLVLSTRLPGSITPIHLKPGHVWNIGPGSFMAATMGVNISGNLNILRNFKTAFVGESPVYTRVQLAEGVPAGIVWIGAYGGVEQHNVELANETLFINNGNFLAMPAVMDGVDVWKGAVRVGLPASIAKSFMTDIGFVLKIGGSPIPLTIPVYTQTHNPGHLTKLIRDIARDVGDKGAVINLGEFS